ncbi:MAG: GyrI-like domain-containing protein [Bacteroidota bacterium]|nr:GyrI-like domain-containing protein [Bacteroidota bacterium]
MEKLDLVKYFKTYYSAKTKPELVHIEEASFLSIRGKGDPANQDFAARIKALYSVAYSLKFKFKELKQDFTVAKLEGLWWFDEERYPNLTMTESRQKVPRSDWEYRLLIRMPEYVNQNILTTAINEAAAKKQLDLVKEIELYQMAEGKVVQMLHVGPFAEELKTLIQMHEFIQAHGWQKNGKHHEIYLSDFNKTAPAKLKTILREPVK